MEIPEPKEFGVWRDAWNRNNAATPAAILHEYGDFLVVLGDPAAWPDRGAGPVGRAVLDVETDGQHALMRRQDPGRQARLAENALLGQRWDQLDDAALRLGPDHEPEADGGEPDTPDDGILRAPPPWPTRLRGKTAMALLFVSGPTEALQITRDDEDEIRAQAQEAASYLARQAPNLDVSFAHTWSRARVSTQPPQVTTNHNATEEPWRNAALGALGLPQGRAGLVALGQRKRAETGADAAYLIILTRYPLTHYAYADVPGGKITVNISTFNSQLTNLDAVLAHESGHIFGAPDEYGSCRCSSTHGPFAVSNANCINCGSGQSDPCLMRDLAWKMCPATRYHLGYTGLPPAGPALTS